MGEARYVTAEHLDLEEWLLPTAVVAESGLELAQRAAAQGLLTSQRGVGPDGLGRTGKTYSMAHFSGIRTERTGGAPKGPYAA